MYHLPRPWGSASGERVVGKGVMRMRPVQPGLVIDVADHEDPPPDIEHVHRGSVQLSQRPAGDHLVRWTGGPAAVGEVQHPVGDREHRVDLVRDEDH